MITRRQFLIGSAAGLILPNWILKAEHFLKNEGEPLIELPNKVNHVLTAFNEGDDFLLYLDYDPEPVMPELTWDQFIRRYNFTNGEPIEDYEYSLRLVGYQGNLKQIVDEQTVFDFWLETEGPSVKAYEMLETLDLDELFQKEGRGDLRFCHSFNPHDSTRHVIANDEMTLSLLQKKMNILDMSVQIRIE